MWLSLQGFQTYKSQIHDVKAAPFPGSGSPSYRDDAQIKSFPERGSQFQTPTKGLTLEDLAAMDHSLP